MKTVLVRIWGLAPDEAERVLSEIADEKLLQAQLAQALAVGPQPVGGPNPDDQNGAQGGQRNQGQPPNNQQQQAGNQQQAGGRA
jgi:hypothetical protein